MAKQTQSNPISNPTTDSTVLIKLWYWIMNNKLNVLKELKQLQLQIADTCRRPRNFCGQDCLFAHQYRTEKAVIHRCSRPQIRLGFIKRWNVFHSPPDFYYRTMPKSREQIYDELLVLKCQQADREAFNELVARWQKRLWNYAFRVTGSESAAWDIVQETWFGIIKGIRRLEDVAVFPQWAFRILNNKCADWLRKQHLQNNLNDHLANKSQNEPGGKQNSNEKEESLRVAIIKLPSDLQALLMLRYHEDFDIGQIAEILGIPEGTVKSRIHRTIEQLRQLMESQQNE